MYQIADPHHQFQFQFVRAPHGPVQAKCQATFSKIETGCSCQTIWTMAMNMRLKMKPKNAASVTSPRPPIKDEEPKTNDQATEKCSWGPDCPFCKSQKKEEETRYNSQRCHPNQNYKNHRLEDPRLKT